MVAVPITHSNAIDVACGFVELEGTYGVVFSPGNDGILHSVLFALIGVGLYQYRKRHPLRAWCFVNP
jgi:hypothetical protein